MPFLKNDLFLRACKRLPVERTPVWVMRQAGRYLPEYRAVRQRFDFMTMCKTPELAAEVTLQPVDIIGVDAAIIFSDILVIPEAMGLKLIMHEGQGPDFPDPIRNREDIDRVRLFDPSVELRYVLDAVSLAKRQLAGRIPLIGFCGAPWTLLTYMVEGQSTKSFSKVKNFIYTYPQEAHRLLEMIVDMAAEFLSAKIEAGVDAVQIFDTWGGVLSPDDFEMFSLQYIERIISQVKRKGQPVIVFAKSVHSRLNRLADCGADVLGLDWTLDIGEVREMIGHKVALQGNLDPTVLYMSTENIAQKAWRILESYGNHNGHIFNLGHGILPDTSPDHLKFLVDFIKEKSGVFHTERDPSR